MAPRRHGKKAAAAMLAALALWSTGAACVEVRGAMSNPAKFREAKMSSTATVVNAFTGPEKAVDGNRGMHLQFDGCAISEKQDSPWWRVDFGYRIPIAVVRIFGRWDEGSILTIHEGLQLRVGDAPSWSDNEVCWGGENITLELRAATVANCIGAGRYLFVVAPWAKNQEMGLCEIEVVPRGPSQVFDWQAAVGRRFDIEMEGQAFDKGDRIRIIDSLALCGEASSMGMHSTVIPRSAPISAPTEAKFNTEKWEGVVMTTMGFFKVCWCSGIASGSCSTGEDFTFIAGYVLVSGEFRTIVGPDILPFVEPSDNDTAPAAALSTVNTASIQGVTIDDTGSFLWFSEFHRLREVDLRTGLVRTVVGKLNSSACQIGEACGDGGPGAQAWLFNPVGVSYCEGEVLIADSGNHRIRSYKPATGVIRTLAGTGERAYRGDDGPALQAAFNRPTGVTCDKTRGFWVADAGNYAVRLVERQWVLSPGEGVVRRAAGGIGPGSSSSGDWSSSSHINGVGQVALTKDALGYSWSVAYAEIGVPNFTTPFARYVPLVGNGVTGPLQTAVGTGVAGYESVTVYGGDMKVMLNSPEGLAVDDGSTMFVADTGNHRILMVPFVQYRFRGCFKEYIAGSSSGPLVPSIEKDPEATLSGGDLVCEPPDSTKDNVLVQRPNAVQECARAAHLKGWQFFAVRCGGVCASAANAGDRYNYLGLSETCSLGRGSAQANSVYELVPGPARDILGRAYVISGTAFSAGGRPSAQFFGDWQSAWTSSVNSPAQLAFDSARKNLYVVDRGNKRIRAIMGSLGPAPTNQFFRCVNGMSCGLSIRGNALSSKDYISFARVTTTPEEVVCGTDRFEDQFPSNVTRVDRTNWPLSIGIFSQKDFVLGKLELSGVGDFRICYCYGGELHQCDKQEEYEFPAGILEVSGPNANHDIRAIAGPRFNVLLFGHKLTQRDSIMLISADEPCGKPTTQVPVVINFTWIGCFEDDTQRDFDTHVPFDGAANTSACAQACWNYTYIALEWGVCRCGNAYSTEPQYRQVNDSECGAPCPGEVFLTPLRRCGLSSRNAVYQIKPNSTDAQAWLPYSFPKGAREEGDDKYEVWNGAFAMNAMELAICWCNRGGECTNGEDFKVRAGLIHVEGPRPIARTLHAGVSFDILLEGSGAFKSSDRVRLQPASVPCAAAGPRVTSLEQDLPSDAAPCAWSAMTERWCGIVIEEPGHYHVCWCGGGRCVSPEDYRVLAQNLTVVVPPVVRAAETPGKFYRPPLPVDPISATAPGWPRQLFRSANASVTVRAWTRRGVPGASSVGPVEFHVCEGPARCLAPVVLGSLTEERAVWKTLAASFPPQGGDAFEPSALWVKALSSDPWLPEVVEVEFSSGGPKRFPLNRWLVAEGGEGSVAMAQVNLPVQTLPTSDSVYTPGDFCGGCQLGYECVEVPLSPLKLARLGLPASTARFEWECRPRCGDGMLVGEEQCDDDNLLALDGCSSECRVEAGFECFSEHSTVASKCRPFDCNVTVSDNSGREVCSPLDLHRATLTSLNATTFPIDAPVIACRHPRTAEICGRPRPPVFFEVWPYAPPKLTLGCESFVADETEHCGYVAPRPRGIRATVEDGGSLLVLAFDSPVRLAEGTIGEEWPCGQTFAPVSVGAFGEGASCTWGSSRHVLVRMGFGATVGMDNSTDLRVVSVLDAARQHAGLAEELSVPVYREWANTSQRVGVLQGVPVRAAPPPVPVVLLQGPAVAGVCGSTFVEGVASSGANGHSWRSASWDCVGSALCSGIIGLRPCAPQLLSAGLGSGPKPACLVLDVPEPIAIQLGGQGAAVNISLTLTNSAGVRATGLHSIRFTTASVPLGVALTPRTMSVEADAHRVLRFEVLARAAEQGSCIRGKSLGPLGVTWRLGLLSNLTAPWSRMDVVFAQLADAAQENFTSATPTALQGPLGRFAVPGATLLVVARVAHAAVLEPTATLNAEPAYVAFRATVELALLSWRIEAPPEVVVGCGFRASLVGEPSPATADLVVDWSCTRTDLTPAVEGLGANPCGDAQLAGAHLDMPPNLVPGVYSLRAQVREVTTRRQRAVVAFVTVREGVAPPVVWQPSPGAVATGVANEGNETPSVRINATVMRLSSPKCRGGERLFALVALRGSAPSGVAPIDLDIRALSKPTVLTGAENSLVEAEVDAESLKAGLEYRFQLLLSPSFAALEAFAGHLGAATASAWPPPPNGVALPASVALSESGRFSRQLPSLVALWVLPAEGLAARTLFRIAARTAACEGCSFAFRFVEGVAADDGGPLAACDVGDAAEWRELRPWSSDSELWRPFLAGNFTIEVRARRPGGGISRACRPMRALEVEEGLALDNITDSEATRAVTQWATDTSQSLEVLRSTTDVKTIVSSIYAISKSFPSARSVKSLPVEGPLRLVFSEVCDSISDVVQQLPASAFLPPAAGRRLDVDAAPLVPLAESLLLATQALAQLLLPSQLWEALAAFRAFLSANVAAGGVLGASGSGDAPPAAKPLLTVLGLVLERAIEERIAVSGAGSIAARNASALAADAMREVRRLGDAVAAALPMDTPGPPTTVQADGGGPWLSVKHYSGNALATSGLRMEPPLDTIRRAPYPKVTIPALGRQKVVELQTNLTTAGIATERCLGTGNAKPFDGIALMVAHWATDPFHDIAIDGSAARVLVVRDIRLRTCGVDWELTSAALGEKDAELVIEVPEVNQTDVTTGYGSKSQFRCVRWHKGQLDHFGSWVPDGCHSTYRAWGDFTELGVDVPDGATHCACDLLSPATWALEAVPRPFYEDVVVFGNSSGHNLVTYLFVFLFLAHLPFVLLAWYGDFSLALDSKDEEENCARLLPWAMDTGGYGGARFSAAEKLSRWPFLMRSVLMHEVLTVVLVLAALCRRERGYRSPEVLEIPRRRLIAAREAAKRAAFRGPRVRPADEAAVAAGRRVDTAAPPERRGWLGFKSRPALPQSPANVGPSSIFQKPVAHDDRQPIFASLEDQDGRPQIGDIKKMGLEDYDKNYATKGNATGAKVELKPGAVVGISGLVGAKALNGQIGVCESWDAAKGRWLVRLRDGGGEVKALKPENLTSVGEAEWGASIRQEVAMSEQGPGERRTSTTMPPETLPVPGTQSLGPLPEGWIARKAEGYSGRYYWVNLLSGKSTWVQPTTPAVKELSVQEMRALLGGKADHVNLRMELEDMLRSRIAERMQELDFEDRDGEDHLEVTSFCSATPHARDSHGNLDRESAPLAKGMMRDGVHRAGPPVVFGPPIEDGAPGQEVAAGPRDAAVARERPGELTCPDAASPSTKATESESVVPVREESPGAVALHPGPQAPVASLNLAPEEVPLRVRLEFLDYTAFKVLWLCWLRSFPLSNALAPRLLRPRVARAMALMLRHFFALGCATLITAFQRWDPVGSEEVAAIKRGMGVLFQEVNVAMGLPEAVPWGLCALAGGSVLAAAATPALVLHKSAAPEAKESLQVKVTWWRRARRRLKLSGLAAAALCALVAGGGGVLAAVVPQPRTSVAAAFFIIALLLDLVLVPILRTLCEASLVALAGRGSGRSGAEDPSPARRRSGGCCCRCVGSFADALLSQLPSVLDFRLAQMSDWTSSRALLSRLLAIVEEQRSAEAVANKEEPPLPLGFKAKRLEEPKKGDKPKP